MTDLQTQYAESRWAWRETNNLPGPMEGYGGKGSGCTDKLLRTNPKAPRPTPNPKELRGAA